MTKKAKDLEDRIAEAIDAAEAETGDQPVAEEAAPPPPAGVFYVFYKLSGFSTWAKEGPFSTKREATGKALELAEHDCELMIVKCVGSVEWQKVAKIV